MSDSPSRWDFVPVGGLWLYAVLISVWLNAGWGGPAAMDVLADWNPAPADLALLGYMLPSLRRRRPGPRHLGWRLVFLAIALSLIGDLVWLYALHPLHRGYALLADAAYLPYYAALALACGCFFFDQGGSFRAWRTWIDITTLALGLGAVIWLFVISPALATAGTHGTGVPVLFAYASGMGLELIMAALLCTQVSDWRTQGALALLIAAIMVGFTADLDWLRIKAAESFPIDSYWNIGAYCFFDALIGTAMLLERRRATAASVTAASVTPASGTPAGEVHGHSFLPTLVVLLAMALLLGQSMSLQDLRGAVLVGFALIGGVLLTARQLGVRHQLRSLQLALEMRKVEARLTEIVRRSSDLIVIVARDGRLAYVSPASEGLLGKAPAALEQTPATRLLGEENVEQLGAFFEEIARHRLSNAETTALIKTPAGTNRNLHVLGSDQSANPFIGGIALSLRDVTEQRRLELEVLAAVSHEQERLAGDIHEGLGQELTGIALFLRAHAREFAREAGSAQESLSAIVAHVNRTIDLARGIARGLSPLRVARGSLDLALGQLAADMRERHGLLVRERCALHGTDVSAGAADHLYRIAVEALSNAARHSRCSAVDVTLFSDERQWTLSIVDDGVGLHPAAASGPGLGLRMMSYRARAMGGALHIDRAPGGGTRIVVTVPRGIEGSAAQRV